MLKRSTSRTVLVAVFLAVSGVPVQPGDVPVSDTLLEELVALERAALDKWIAVNPDGYIALYAPDVTYFDPTTDTRIDGHPLLSARLAPMRGAKLPFTNARYEMIAPKVQEYGDVAVLTFNLVNYGTPPGGAETVVARWNSTEVYRRSDGKWRIIHSHWSFTKPELKPSL